MKNRTDWEARDRAYEAQRDAHAEIRAITAVAEHFIRNGEISGADALLKAIDLVRSVRTVAA